MIEEESLDEELEGKQEEAGEETIVMCGFGGFFLGVALSLYWAGDDSFGKPFSYLAAVFLGIGVWLVWGVSKPLLTFLVATGFGLACFGVLTVFLYLLRFFNEAFGGGISSLSFGAICAAWVSTASIVLLLIWILDRILEEKRIRR